MEPGRKTSVGIQSTAGSIWECSNTQAQSFLRILKQKGTRSPAENDEINDEIAQKHIKPNQAQQRTSSSSDQVGVSKCLVWVPGMTTPVVLASSLNSSFVAVARRNCQVEHRLDSPYLHPQIDRHANMICHILYESYICI